jgi:hypothetical protein
MQASEGESESSHGSSDEEDRVASTAAPNATISSGPSSFASWNECSVGGKDKEDRREEEGGGGGGRGRGVGGRWREGGGWTASPSPREH